MNSISPADNELNTEILHDLLNRGASKLAIAKDYGISVRDLNRITGDVKSKKQSILDYREIQHLQLTELQSKLLAGITEDKIMCASLTEIVNAFKSLKDKELVIQGKATQITGIVGYLVALEKEEAQKNAPIEIEDYEDVTEVEEEENYDLPNL